MANWKYYFTSNLVLPERMFKIRSLLYFLSILFHVILFLLSADKVGVIGDAWELGNRGRGN